jgi:SAM-dependent methyltransferase
MAGCCGESKTDTAKTGCCGADAARTQVREGYARVAREQGSCCGPAGCGTDTAQALAEGVGYAASDLETLPEGANMGLSCGNPTALASLREGEVVVDLGSGGGFDVFLAARRVGETGRSIGVDMTPDMLDTARRNAAAFREAGGPDTVEFRLGEIEHLPLADNSADVVISNCVINLSPEKAQVWREMARVLRPGGRVAVSDMAILRPLPEAALAVAESLVGCVAGAVTIEETVRMAEAAGFADVQVERKDEAFAAMGEFKDERYRAIHEALPEGEALAAYLTSVNVTARMPAACCGRTA